MAIVNVSLQDLRHHISEAPKERPEVASKEGAGHVKSLLAIVVSIILIDKTQTGLDEFVGHVAEEEGLLVHTIRED